MADAHANFAYGLVTVVPSPAVSGTTLTVSLTTGWPTVPFNATVWPFGSNPANSNAEIVRVTANAAGAFTITRTQESTTARTILAGDIISANPTAKTFTDAEGLVLFAAHGAWSPTASVTYYWGAFPHGGPGTTADIMGVGVPKTGTVTRVESSMLIATTNGGSGNQTFILRKNGVDAVTLSSTKVFNGGVNALIRTSYSGLSIAVTAGDRLEFKEALGAFGGGTTPVNVFQSAQILVV